MNNSRSQDFKSVADYSLGTVGTHVPRARDSKGARNSIAGSRVGDHVDRYDYGSFEQTEERERYRPIIRNVKVFRTLFFGARYLDRGRIQI